MPGIGALGRIDFAIVPGPIAALVGLAMILTVLSIVWILSLRLRDASVADICWGLGFVLLVWFYFVL